MTKPEKTETTTKTESKVQVTCWALVTDDSFESCGAPAQVWATFGWPPYTWPLCYEHLKAFQERGERVKVELLDVPQN